MIFELGIIALAAWRLAYALVYEDVFAWLRYGIGIRFEITGHVTHRSDGDVTQVPIIGEAARNPIARMFQCVYCTSFWTGLLFYALWTVGAEPVVIVFAIAGGAVLVDKWHG